MSKFCGSCGKELDDAARVCGYCGAQLEGAPADITNTPGGKTGFFTAARTKLCGIGAAVIAVIIAIIITVSSFTGASAVERKIVKAFESGNSALFASMISPSALDMYDSRDWDEYFYECYFDDYDNYDDVSAEIIESEDATDLEYRDFIEELREDGVTRWDVSKVRHGYIKIKFKMNGGYSYRYQPYTVTKENGEWYLFQLKW